MSERRPAIEGWFAEEPEPHLLGSRGIESGGFFFPPSIATSANPAAPFEAREPVALSRRGTVWSWTTNHYPPPPPAVNPDPFVPYTVVAVELPTERMVVLGRLAADVDPSRLSVGAEVEVAAQTLLVDDDGAEQTIWCWRPTGE